MRATSASLCCVHAPVIDLARATLVVVSLYEKSFHRSRLNINSQHEQGDKFFEMFVECSEMFVECSSNVHRMFRNVRRMFENVRRMFGNVRRMFGNVCRMFGNVRRMFGNVRRM